MQLSELLQRRGIRCRFSNNDPQELRMCCLFCTDQGESQDTRYRLCINIRSGAGKCWNCGWKSRHAVNAVLKRLRIDTSDLESEAATFSPPPEPVKLPHGFYSLDKIYDDLDRMALRYLLKRGITRTQIKHNNIGVSFLGQYAYRIVFPVMVNGQLKGFTARDITGNSRPKYLGSPGDKYLYAFNPEAEVCVLSEGVFKALRIQQITSWCSAALLGHTLNELQLEQIKQSRCRKAIIWADPDRVGRQGAISVADCLSERWSGETLIIPIVTKSADEVPLKELESTLNTATPYNWSSRQKLSLYFE